MYRILQESLTNIYRHAQAKTASIVLRQNEDSVYLEIWDDGCGMAEDALLAAREKNRLGLFGIQERVELLGGSLEIISSPGAGTRLFVTLPKG